MKMNIAGLRWYMRRYRLLLEATDRFVGDLLIGQFSVGDEVERVRCVEKECEELLARGVTEVQTAENSE